MIILTKVTAKQLLFFPLPKSIPTLSSSGCFAWSRSGTPGWSRNLELSFCATFGDCLAAEIVRLDVVEAEQRKNDFISSISHELRSPLHGILASTQFLEETQCNVFQKSLIDTIGSCGRTLLDTINHVLDFTKINSFENHHVKDHTLLEVQADGLQPGSSTAGASPSNFKSGDSFNISSSLNVAVICEEVVEGLIMGKAGLMQAFVLQSYAD